MLILSFLFIQIKIREWNQGQGFALVQSMASTNKSNTLSTASYDQLGSYIDQYVRLSF